jgi:hypothetical protein
MHFIKLVLLVHFLQMLYEVHKLLLCFEDIDEITHQIPHINAKSTSNEIFQTLLKSLLCCMNTRMSLVYDSRTHRCGASGRDIILLRFYAFNFFKLWLHSRFSSCSSFTGIKEIFQTLLNSLLCCMNIKMSLVYDSRSHRCGASGRDIILLRFYAFNCFKLWLPLSFFILFLPYRNQLMTPFLPFADRLFTNVLHCKHFCNSLPCFYCNLPLCSSWGALGNINF